MIEQTKSIMAELKCLGALHTLDQRLSDATTHGWGHAEFLSALFTDEKLYRDQNKIGRRIKYANFRTTATFERIDYTLKRTITKTLVRDLMNLAFLKRPQNVLITGATGVGKTYLATAIGEYACSSGFTCIFIGISVFIERLLMSRSDGTYLRHRDRLIKCDLLIIDDVGLKKLPPEIVIDLHDILEERQMRCTLITTQLPLKNWKEIIGDELALDTIVDKLKHGTLHLLVEGDTARDLKNKKRVVDKQSVPEDVEATQPSAQPLRGWYTTGKLSGTNEGNSTSSISKVVKVQKFKASLPRRLYRVVPSSRIDTIATLQL